MSNWFDSDSTSIKKLKSCSITHSFDYYNSDINEENIINNIFNDYSFNTNYIDNVNPDNIKSTSHFTNLYNDNPYFRVQHSLDDIGTFMNLVRYISPRLDDSFHL